MKGSKMNQLFEGQGKTLSFFYTDSIIALKLKENKNKKRRN